jgi:hypothetical protein
MACRVAGPRQASNHFLAFLWDGCESEPLMDQHGTGLGMIVLFPYLPNPVPFFMYWVIFT